MSTSVSTRRRDWNEDGNDEGTSVAGGAAAIVCSLRPNKEERRDDTWLLIPGTLSVVVGPVPGADSPSEESTLSSRNFARSAKYASTSRIISKSFGICGTGGGNSAKLLVPPPPCPCPWLWPSLIFRSGGLLFALSLCEALRRNAPELSFFTSPRNFPPAPCPWPLDDDAASSVCCCRAVA